MRRELEDDPAHDGLAASLRDLLLEAAVGERPGALDPARLGLRRRDTRDLPRLGPRDLTLVERARERGQRPGLLRELDQVERLAPPDAELRLGVVLDAGVAEVAKELLALHEEEPFRELGLLLSRARDRGLQVPVDLARLLEP